jgi:ribonuclease T2
MRVNTLAHRLAHRLARGGVTALAAMLWGVALASHHGHHAGHGQLPADAGLPGQFDYYLLSLSWSPTYCLTHRDDLAQCERSGLGFVLHGLWPQYDTGAYPENCTVDAPLGTQAIELGQRLFPSVPLLRHEWQRHGSCTGLDAEAYFRTADRALGAVRIPAVFDAPRAPLSLSAAQIAAAFQRANPAMPAGALTVACRSGELLEVRICLGRDLQLRACGPGVRSRCPVRPVRIPATR